MSIYERLIYIDGYEKIGKTTLLRYIKSYFETFDYNVIIKKEEFSKDKEFFKKDKNEQLKIIAESRIESLKDSIEQLNENENLIIIYDRLFYSTFMYQFEFNNIEFIKYLKNNFLYDFFKNIQGYIFTPESKKSLYELKNRINYNDIHGFDGWYIDKEKFKLLHDLSKSFLSGFGCLHYIYVDTDISKKGMFLQWVFKRQNTHYFKLLEFQRMITTYIIEDLSTLYNTKHHGELLSVCRNKKPLSYEKCISTIKMRHLSTLQFFSYTFFIEDLPRTVLIELSRYRTINAMCVESTRYVLNNIKNPDDKIYKYSDEIVKKISIESLRKIIDNKDEISIDKLKMALPENFTCNLYFKIDMRNFSHIIFERIDPSAHKEFRRLMFSMLYNISTNISSDANILPYIID